MAVVTKQRLLREALHGAAVPAVTALPAQLLLQLVLLFSPQNTQG